MPRKERMETSEGIYHVINRGNYRSFIFASDGAKVSFEAALFEACMRFGWELKAYAVLSNHFHLCVGTPQGNLSEGMRWLQSTFAMRFNRYRGERGHLFQGRFKALVVEPGESVLGLVNYIHLNPARAGLVASDRIPSYRWSSLYHFPKRARRPGFLDARWIAGMVGGDDSRGGWQRYAKLLEVEMTRDPLEIAALEKAMTRGWCIGSRSFKQAMAADYFEGPTAVRLEREELKEVNRMHWEAMLKQCLEHFGVGREAVESDKYSAEWKLAIAAKLKRESSVSNRWLSEHLRMGAPNAVSNNCGRYAREREKSCRWAKQLRNMNYEY